MGMFSSDNKVVELEMADGSIETINLSDMAKVKGLTSLAKRFMEIGKTIDSKLDLIRASSEDEIEGFIAASEYMFNLYEELKLDLDTVFGEGFTKRISGVGVPGVEFYSKFIEYLLPHISGAVDTDSEFASDEVISADIVNLYGESSDGRDVTW